MLSWDYGRRGSAADGRPAELSSSDSARPGGGRAGRGRHAGGLSSMRAVTTPAAPVAASRWRCGPGRRARPNRLPVHPTSTLAADMTSCEAVVVAARARLTSPTIGDRRMGGVTSQRARDANPCSLAAPLLWHGAGGHNPVDLTAWANWSSAGAPAGRVARRGGNISY